MKRSLILGAVSVAATAALVRWQLARLFTEQPRYTVERRLGPIEIRRYPPSLRAETTVQAYSWHTALNEGFRRLAGYIFGGNHERAKIAMTAPVTGTSGGEAIAMTAPVTGASSGVGSWTVTFTLPANRDMSSLPEPNDARVVLRAVPARRVAVLRYAGGRGGDRVAEKAEALLGALDRAGIRGSGMVEYAGYDPPTTLPLLRRNEVWVELEGEPAVGSELERDWVPGI